MPIRIPMLFSFNRVPCFSTGFPAWRSGHQGGDGRPRGTQIGEGDQGQGDRFGLARG